MVSIAEHRAALKSRAEARQTALERGIALDDLGAGYAGLSQLIGLEPDFVKVDRDLIRGIDTDCSKRTLVKSIVSACHDLEIELVCEGVESASEARSLLAMGVAVGIGNRLGRALGRPTHLDEIEDNVRRLVRRGDSQPTWTSSGLKLSAHALPDGTVDLVCSHARLTPARIEHVADALFAQHRIVACQTAGLFHIVVARDQLQPNS